MAEALHESRSVEVGLVDLLDRLIAKGVTVNGDLILAVAGVDLVRLNLRTLLGAVDVLPGGHGNVTSAPAPAPARRSTVTPAGHSPRAAGTGARPAARVDASPEDADRGLGRLVLVVLDLLRELMERQAINRIERGTVDEDATERMGVAFMKLQERMQDLRDSFGLSPEDIQPSLRLLDEYQPTGGEEA